jgi:3-isopropylmalate/(R)-2-methylmalate dehydratase small subunit
MNRVFHGRVWKFPDDVNTDVIYPGRYMSILDPVETAKHAFETIYPHFLKEAKPGDVIVAGKYFGCGSSREQAATTLRYFGIACIVADSFARIYYRNAINLGMPVLICPGVSTAFEQGHVAQVNLSIGRVKNLTTGAELESLPLPPLIREILDEGGLIPHLKRRLANVAHHESAPSSMRITWPT